MPGINPAPILYISTNGMWSGSEELWTRSLKSFQKLGYDVLFAAKFESPLLASIDARGLNFADRYGKKGIFERGLRRLFPFVPQSPDLLQEFIRRNSPRLVIISQGNNYEAIDIMRLCVDLNIAYVTLTQLVAEYFVFAINDSKFSDLQQLYAASLKNFFVSRNNLKINNFLIGKALENADVVYNPNKLSTGDICVYPEYDNFYQVALVGRIECWHKGYDLLIQVASQDKWKNRPIKFNLYGQGTHVNFIQSHIDELKLVNVTIQGHNTNISEIWQHNQLLLMPSRMEGQSLALIEAMWCQRAAVVTDVGGAAELIDDGINGFIAEIASANAIDAALERAWQNREQWKQMGLNASHALNAKYPSDAVDYFNQQLIKVLESIK